MAPMVTVIAVEDVFLVVCKQNWQQCQQKATKLKGNGCQLAVGMQGQARSIPHSRKFDQILI